MITKVTVIGDIVTVEKQIDGITSTISRHVQEYATMANSEKQKLWFDIAEEPFTDYIAPTELDLKWYQKVLLWVKQEWNKVVGFFKK